MWAKHEIKRGQLIYKEADKKKKQVSCVLWGSRGETRLIKHVQFGARGGLCSDGRFLLYHLHLWHHWVRHGAATGNTHTVIKRWNKHHTDTAHSIFLFLFWSQDRNNICVVTLPPGAEAHAQSLGLLSLLAFQVLNLLFLHLPVDLQLFVGQTHRGHTAKSRPVTSDQKFRKLHFFL